MWKTVVFLVVTVVVLPFLAFRFDVPLTEGHLDILWDLVSVYAVATLLVFVVSTLTGNYSQVDKLWSILPIIYVWMVAWQTGFEPRILLMALMVTAWGGRLTYNFNRRGGYSIRFWTGEEDYRWSILRAKPEFQARWKWTLFNLLFISAYQMALILLMTLPALRSVNGRPLHWYDFLIAGLMLLFIILETIADQQQWDFHQQKKKDPEGSKGFVDHGLWGIVRHPNYAAEQAIWITFYFFSVSATGQWLNWSVIGAMLLLLLFKGSSDFSEGVSAGKYAEYGAYQKAVPRFVPFRSPLSRG